MSTVEDFENAPAGATATNADGIRAMKINDGERRWIIQTGTLYYTDKAMVYWGYTLDPLEPRPTSAREALDLAWELAHEVEPGQVIPADTRFMQVTGVGVGECIAHVDFEIDPSHVTTIRTLEPLPDLEPEWVDAPAVLARLKTWIPSAVPTVFTRYEHDHGYWLAIDPPAHHWSELTDVTPLYPKGQDT